MDDVRDGVLVHDPAERVEVGDVALDDRHLRERVLAHDQAQAPGVRRAVERDDRHALVDERLDRPGADAPKAAGDEEALASRRRRIAHDGER